jgi:S-adenosylmethionine synthetase
MGAKLDKSIDLTLCIPQISRYVKNEIEYKNNLNLMRKIIFEFIKNDFPKFNIGISINTRDDFDTGELYLTAIGSSIESGDEGLVGRGNRINRLICQVKPYTMEGVAGKNPVYHVGKIYSIAAQELADKISKKTKAYTEVFLLSQSGRLLVDPWRTIIGIEKDLKKEERIYLIKFIQKELERIPKITKRVVNLKIRIS